MTKQIDNPLVIIFALSVLCACQFGQTIPADLQISTIAQPTSPLDLSPQNISLFGEVALRALTHQRGNIGLSKVQLWPGKVPTSWSVKLPLLNETVIIGSLSAEQGIDPVIQVFLDVVEPLENVTDAYQIALTNQGFEEIIPFGFSQSVPRPEWRAHSYCRTDIDVSVEAEMATETVTRVIVSQGLFELSPCSTSPHSGLPPLPQLLTDPEDTIGQRGSSFSMAEGNQILDRGLLTTLSLDELMAHYTDQLRKQGWTPVDAGSSNYVVWSLWRFKDLRNKVWVGTVWVSGNLISPTSKQLRIQVDRVPDQ